MNPENVKPHVCDSLISDDCRKPGHPRPNDVPRVARSLNDLRVGQSVIVKADAIGQWRLGTVRKDHLTGGFIVEREDSGGTVPFHAGRYNTQVVILEDAPDPPAEPVTIPRDIYDRLKAAVDEWRANHPAGWIGWPTSSVTHSAERLVDAVEGANDE